MVKSGMSWWLKFIRSRMITKGCDRSHPSNFDLEILDAFYKISERFGESFNSDSEE